jgi:membrane associated rhomboid family serine protease
VPSAFLHFGFAHVGSNSIPLLIFGFLAALGSIRRFLAVAALIIVIDGLGVWLVSPANTVCKHLSGPRCTEVSWLHSRVRRRGRTTP